MKKFLSLLPLLIYLSSFSQNSKPLQYSVNQVENTSKFLNAIAKYLNEVIPQDTVFGLPCFRTYEDNQTCGFFVFDLNNTKNNTENRKNPFSYINNHIYHFGPVAGDIAISFIAFNEKDSLHYFNALNCEGKGDKIENAIEYLLTNMIISKENKELIRTIRNYRKYGEYFYIDYQSLELHCESYHEKK